MPTALEIEQRLREAELRVTRVRIAVLSAVHERPHADTNSIIDTVREQLGDVSHQAVYDVLEALTRAGLLRRIQPSRSVARYESRIGDNHHHIVCRSCGSSIGAYAPAAPNQASNGPIPLTNKSAERPREGAAQPPTSRKDFLV
jgi:Fe2+ or Zn2+ uptake regulation protein